MILAVILRPHLERGGYHTERFDACLGDDVICTSRSSWHAPARELLRRGCAPETLVRVQHEGRVFDPTIVPQPLGEIAQWEIGDEDRDGLVRRRWRPRPDDPLATLYPRLWTEPSAWPWDSATRTGRASPAAEAA